MLSSEKYNIATACRPTERLRVSMCVYVCKFVRERRNNFNENSFVDAIRKAKYMHIVHSVGEGGKEGNERE